MAVEFPSAEFFQELADRMNADRVTFEKLGYCDTRMGARVLTATPRLFALTFDVYECVEVKEVDPSQDSDLDFVLEAAPEVWKDMIDAIRQHGGADAANTLNSLSHVGDRIRVAYDDPEGHDKFYRFMASLQAYFDLACEFEVEFA
jgi:hypothetical protein